MKCENLQSNVLNELTLDNNSEEGCGDSPTREHVISRCQTLNGTRTFLHVWATFLINDFQSSTPVGTFPSVKKHGHGNVDIGPDTHVGLEREGMVISNNSNLKQQSLL
ncbi:hypothetical protein TNCV_1654831 [Trichonephila clavipes]|nr:hypothetical protein TNCV_1654831 [Trichonephila clavipes]